MNIKHTNATGKMTFAETYLANRIAAYDDLLTRKDAHPRDGIDAWMSLQTAMRVAYPTKSEPAIREDLKACFPHLNSRWS